MIIKHLSRIHFETVIKHCQKSQKHKFFTIFFNNITKICKIIRKIEVIKIESMFKTEEFALNPNSLKLGLLQFESKFSEIKR